LTPAAIGALNAQEPEITGPLNPAFIKWQAEQKQRLALRALGYTEPNENRYGHIPDQFLPPTIDRPATQIEAMVKAGLASYPAYYNLKQENLLAPARNQGVFGTCWAFGALASIESNIVMTTGIFLDLSEWHLAWFGYNPWNDWPAFPPAPNPQMGPDMTFDQGGSVSKAVAILTRGTGPVLEADSPYQNNTNYLPSTLPKGTEPTVVAIKDAHTFGSRDQDTIKGLITTNGAVKVSIQMETSNNYFNDIYNAYRYITNYNTNHDVAIIGWNDDFPSTNFPAGNRPATNGAWIIRNSYGPAFGDGGCFYMSYDTTFGGIASFEVDFEVDRKIYQYDLLGGNSTIMYMGNPPVWVSNVFTAEGNETITDVSVSTGVQNVPYTITIKTGVTGNPTTGVQVLTQQGTMNLPGYHRVKLDSPVKVSGGEKFAVIVSLVEQGNLFPIRVCAPDDETSYTPAAPGVGYYSFNGTSWTDVYNDSTRRSIALKAFTVSEISVALDPSAVTIQTGGTYTFTAAVTGGLGNKDVTWSAPYGSITSDGSYTAPATPGTYTITATSVEDITKTGTATVTVIAADIVITDPPKGLITGDTATFQASVTGLSDSAVTWSASSGVITQSGVYTAPATPGTYTITATSVELPTLKVTTDVKISSVNFDGNSKTAPQLLDLANAVYSELQADLEKYDLNGDRIIDNEDIKILFNKMGW
jgi:C1A family cysteine protease